MNGIPIVDFSCLSLDKDKIPEEASEEVTKLSQEIHDAFTSIGFVYIKNHGIQEEKIGNLFQVAEKFFKLPEDVKSQSVRPASGTNQGWVSIGRESLNPGRPGDFKEAFNIEEPGNDALPWPVVDCSSFRMNIGDFYSSCQELALRILDVMSLGMNLEDKTFLRRMHKEMHSDKNATALRLLYYPPVKGPLKDGQVRCGEHSDYGTITLLFQDSVGGLEVCSRKDGYVPARPIEGTIVVNIGDLMQRWTNDKFVSTKHRVGLPDQESLRSVVRHSAAFFVHPNDDALIECLDGSGNYPPVTALEYLNQRFAATY